jgi:hypothetical protein
MPRHDVQPHPVTSVDAVRVGRGHTRATANSATRMMPSLRIGLLLDDSGTRTGHRALLDQIAHYRDREASRVPRPQEAAPPSAHQGTGYLSPPPGGPPRFERSRPRTVEDGRSYRIRRPSSTSHRRVAERTGDQCAPRNDRHPLPREHERCSIGPASRPWPTSPPRATAEERYRDAGRPSSLGGLGRPPRTRAKDRHGRREGAAFPPPGRGPSPGQS